MTFEKPVTTRKTDQGEVCTYDQMHNMPYFVAEESDVPPGRGLSDTRRVSHLAVRRVIRAPFERIDHQSGEREIEEVQISLMISMIGPKRTNTAYGSIALRGDQIDQMITALQAVQVAKSLREKA